MRKLTVNASRTYNIEIGSVLLASAGDMIRQVARGSNAVIVSEDKVWPFYGTVVTESMEKAGFNVCSFVFKSGEDSKNLSVLGEILEYMAEHRLDRKDILVALGGGVVGDMAGFAASIYKRGIDFVQMPTTILSAVDSSVGGKTAVNIPAGKNLVGSFHQPALVICDTDTFGTLSERDYNAGFGEVIKYEILGVPGLTDTDDIEKIIYDCVAYKASVVAEDEFDTGLRQLLNLGHTVGHAIEKATNLEVLHGEGVAIGMSLMARYMTASGEMPESDCRKIEELLKSRGLPTETDLDADTLMDGITSDKKVAGAGITLVLPERIGKCRLEKFDFDQVRQLLIASGVKQN